MHRVGHTYTNQFIKKITIDVSIFQVVFHFELDSSLFWIETFTRA